MTLGYDLNMEQVQKHVMTPELIQAIQILQFNSQELDYFIEEQLLTNPILEIDNIGFSEEKSDEKLDDLKKSEKDSVEADHEEIDWAEYFKEYDDISYNQRDDKSRQESAAYEQRMPSDVTLSEHLLFQLQFPDISKLHKKIGRYIIESLDENGYLTVPLSEIAEEYKVSEKVAESVLAVIQTFDPLGIGARDLKECLLIQLKASGNLYDIAEKMINNHLEDIANNRISCIAKKLNLTICEVQKGLNEIKKLEPKPGRKYGSTYEIKYIIPDVTIEEIDGAYHVNVNDTTAPRLSINSYYRKMLQNADKESPHGKFLASRLNSALWLIRSIEQRRQTIYNVVSAIVESQDNFFKAGQKFMKPLTLKQVAEVVGIHESTVSRAINGKYVLCPRGIYEIKYFFTSGVGNDKGQGIASTGIKTHISELIKEENQTNPLSDQGIVEILVARGIDISRRTVAKYREEMGIPSSSKRRRYGSPEE